MGLTEEGMDGYYSHAMVDGIQVGDAPFDSLALFCRGKGRMIIPQLATTTKLGASFGG